jgi:hypothetical protein
LLETSCLQLSLLRRRAGGGGSLLGRRAGGGASGVVALVGGFGRSRRSARGGARGGLSGSRRRAGGRLGDGGRGRGSGLGSGAGQRTDGRRSKLGGRASGRGSAYGGRAGARSSSIRSGGDAGPSGVGSRDSAGVSSISGKTDLSLEPVGVSSEALSGSGVLVAGLGGSGTVGRLNSSGGAVAIKTGTVLASKGKKLVTLGALGDLDAILVGPFLDLAVRPRVKESIAQALLSGGGGGRNLSISALGVQAGEAGLAAERRNKGVTVGGLRGGVATLVEPRLDVRVGPRRVEPVAGVGSGLAELCSGRLVVLADGFEERVALAGLGNGNAVLVSESLELRVGPAGGC